MKSLLLATIAATTLGIAAASAQSTNNPSGNDAPPAKSATASAAPSGEFVSSQSDGLMRAPKLIGVSVYDSENKSVGKIDDLLVDHDGSVKTVVIGVGGFLGIGKKDIALPFSAIRWQTEQRTVATNQPPPQSGMNQPSTPTGNMKTKAIDPAKTEAYQGYPDRAVLQMTQAQIKSAPEFKYATNPEADASAAPGATQQTPAAKP